MKRAFSVMFISVLLLSLATSLVTAQNSPATSAAAAKSDASQPEPAKLDAMLRSDAAPGITPMVKMNSGRTKAMIKTSLPPPPDGNELAMSCKAEVEGFDAGYCLGVVEGVIASMRVCKSDRSTITLGEAADITEKYLTSHPEQLHERDVVLARKALAKAFPCGVFRR